MSAWWNKALELAARGEAAALVTVCSVSGSAPRADVRKVSVPSSTERKRKRRLIIDESFWAG